MSHLSFSRKHVLATYDALCNWAFRARDVDVFILYQSLIGFSPALTHFLDGCNTAVSYSGNIKTVCLDQNSFIFIRNTLVRRKEIFFACCYACQSEHVLKTTGESHFSIFCTWALQKSSHIFFINHFTSDLCSLFFVVVVSCHFLALEVFTEYWHYSKKSTLCNFARQSLNEW